MGNSLNQDLEGKVVVLAKGSLRSEYHELKHRLFRVSGGFGAKSYTIGTALFGTFLADGDKGRMEGYDVERLATDEECATEVS
ncbi:hypothetical protein LCGC14_2020940 [marine sediment metagenome]|uniref:Uncharacterized protein n=1 Tax=marine sediment metagenome TaxID=412755 RepID=A0A0F9EXU4_9ZZZZ